MPDRTPPAAADLDRRFAEIAACLAHQDQIIEDLKRQNVAMESRIDVLEGWRQGIDADLDEFDRDFERVEKQWEFLNSFVGQLWTHAGRPHVQFSEEHEQIRRGLPRHGGPIGTGLMGVNDVPAQTPADMRQEHYFEGAGGGT